MLGSRKRTPLFRIPLEIEHMGDGVGNPIEAPLANALTLQPIVFDEGDDPPRRIAPADSLSQ